MSIGEMAFLGMAVGAITIFGGVLAWASWMETRKPLPQKETRGGVGLAEEHRPKSEKHPYRQRAF
jgi:hypothetical protein